MLRVSYSVLCWSVLFSGLALSGNKSYEGCLPALGDKIVKIKRVDISRFKNIFEPSAAQQLPDGRLVIIEDESSTALSIVEICSDGSILENVQRDKFLLKAFKRELNDLEGATLSSNGYIYAITSHSRTVKGKRKKSREQIIRFKLNGNKMLDSGSYTKFLKHLKESGILKGVLENKRKFDDVNIEAFSFDKEQNSLLIGFRAPLIDGKSMLVTLENPVGIFERNERARFANKVILLDLKGGGIRSLDYDTHLKGYLISNEVKGENGRLKSQLWFWRGSPGQFPERIDLPERVNLKNIESLAPVTVNGKRRLLLLSDDGNSKKKEGAHYMLLEYDELSGE